jgi:hypothetical protein
MYPTPFILIQVSWQRSGGMANHFDPRNPIESTNPIDPHDPFARMRATANLSANVVMILFVLVNSVLAGLAAILGGPLLLAFTKLVDWDTDLRLLKAWSVTFMAYFGYFCISTLITMDDSSPPATDSLFAPEMLLHIAMLQGPPVLLASAIMLWRLPAYRSVFGFIRAAFFISVSLMLSAAMMYLVLERVTTDGAPGIGYTEGLAMVGLIALVIIVPGSLIAALVIRAGAALGPRQDTPLRFRSILWTAIVILLTWVASVAAFEFLFMTAESMFSWYNAWEPAADRTAYMQAHGSELQLMIGVALGILVIALLIAASVLTSRLAAAFPGRLGWVRAIFTTGTAVAGALAPITALLAWTYLVGGFDDMSQYW